VIGLDIDPAVKLNPLTDESHIISDGHMPLEDGSVDLIVSDWTLEHVDDPSTFGAEVHRILRSGGWFCARTPNKWGLIGIGARAIPNALHARVLRILQPHRDEVDVFPTVYLLNTRRHLRKHFSKDDWEHIVIGWDPEAAYGGRFTAVQRAVRLISRFTPEGLRAVWLVYLRRR
jgi:SAM-dependent methyltransferase